MGRGVLITIFEGKSGGLTSEQTFLILIVGFGLGN